MNRIAFGILAFTLGTFALASAQPPGGGDKGAPGGKGGMRSMGYGKVIPGFMLEQLKLTDDQKKAVEELEKDVKVKLDKILTDDQKKILENPRGPGDRPGEKKGPGDIGKGPGGDKGDKKGAPEGGAKKGPPEGGEKKAPGGERPPQ